MKILPTPVRFLRARTRAGMLLRAMRGWLVIGSERSGSLRKPCPKRSFDTDLRSMSDPADEVLAEQSTVKRRYALVNSSVRCSGVRPERISRALNMAAGGCAPALSNLPSISRNVTAQISGAEKA